MAPMNLVDGESTTMDTRQLSTFVAASMFVFVSFVAIIILCVCGGDDKKKENDKEKQGEKAPPPLSTPSTPGVGDPPTTTPADPLAMSALEKSKGSKGLNSSLKIGKQQTTTSLQLPKKAAQPSTDATAAALEPKSNKEDRKSLALGKAPVAPPFAVTKTPAGSIRAAAASPITPKASPTPINEPPPIAAIKSVRAPTATAPPTVPLTKAEGKAENEDVFKMTSKIAQSVVTPGAGKRFGGANVTPASKPSGMLHADSDDPAYRSLVGLDDAFNATQLAGSVYGAGKTKVSGDSLMPAASGRSVTNSAVSAMTEQSKNTSEEGAAGNKRKSKKKAKK